MKTKEEILDNKFKERGIRKGWIDESKQAVLDAMDEYADEKLRLYHVRRSFPHAKVNLRDEDIEGMISTYEFLVWNNEGEDKKHCKRVLRQLKKAVNYA